MIAVGGSASSRVRGSVAAVILNWNQAELTRQCALSVQEQVDYVYIVDNASDPADCELLYGIQGEKTTLIVNASNVGYAAGCNRGVYEAVKAGFAAVLIMNNDAFPDPGSIGLMVDRLENSPRVGAIGPAVVKSGTREVLHGVCHLDLRTGRTRWPQRGVALDALDKRPVATGYLSGEAMLVRSSVIKQIRMFDERYFCYYEDVDWSLRARRACWRLEIVPQSIFEHIVGASSAGRVGTYYRARNLPLFLRVALGRSRFTALLLAAPMELVAFAAQVRRGRFALAFRGVIGGWLAGVAMKVEDAHTPS